MPEREPFHVADAGAWESWLAANAGSSPGVWLAIPKKGSGRTSPTYAEALDIALCFGWIDGQKAPLDEAFFLQRFAPRGSRSVWSARNREHVARLIAAGRMRPAGLAEVERAKADGRWDAAYAGQASAQVPDDLRAALDAEPAAAALFAELDSANRYAILFRIGSVKRAETRARKIAEYVAMLARGETLHPRRGIRG
ncbi:MAG TPA: YdeI/OmpD-associated family protein [Amnibacterium sp.]|jgi:uncharacterized protein YdeI (YjbR/CyaY-like superfamily)|uniref:YdeI/OmpD-associated family protein n=1 Tax=Amnibacterium sp. TaxID=1872496 RepID=UPI002F91EDAE